MKTTVYGIITCLILLTFVLFAVSCSDGSAGNATPDAPTTQKTAEIPSASEGQPTEKTSVPRQSGSALTPSESAVTTAETTETPVESTETPAETTETPVEPTVTPTETTETPVEPTVTPTETTETPVEPTVTPTVIENEPIKFSLNSVSGKPGETVTLMLTVEDNPGIAGYQVSLLYDADKLEVVSVAIKLGRFGTSNSRTPGVLTVMATDQGINPLKQNGDCAEIVLKIKETVLPGEEFILTPGLIKSGDSVYQSPDAGLSGYPEYPAEFFPGIITVTA